MNHKLKVGRGDNMNDLKISTEKEAKIYLLGIIEGLNKIRLSVWGFGYDNDETAGMIRKITTERILEIKEMLDIDSFGDQSFSTVKEYVKANAQSTK